MAEFDSLIRLSKIPKKEIDIVTGKGPKKYFKFGTNTFSIDVSGNTIQTLAILSQENTKFDVEMPQVMKDLAAQIVGIEVMKKIEENNAKNGDKSLIVVSQASTVIVENNEVKNEFMTDKNHKWAFEKYFQRKAYAEKRGISVFPEDSSKMSGYYEIKPGDSEEMKRWKQAEKIYIAEYNRYMDKLSTRIRRFAKKNYPDRFESRPVSTAKYWADAEAHGSPVNRYTIKDEETGEIKTTYKESKGYAKANWVNEHNEEFLDKVVDFINNFEHYPRKITKADLKNADVHFDEIIKFNKYMTTHHGEDFAFYEKAYNHWLKTGQILEEDGSIRGDKPQRTTNKTISKEDEYYSGIAGSANGEAYVDNASFERKLGLYSAIDAAKKAEEDLHNEIQQRANVKADQLKRMVAYKPSNKVPTLSTTKLPVKQMSFKKSVPRAKNASVGRSSLLFKGIKEMFKPAVETIITKSGKEISFLAPAFEETATYRTNRLNKIEIPEEFVKSGVMRKRFGSFNAAFFFQHLVAGTPLDEEYDRDYIYKKAPEEIKVNHVVPSFAPYEKMVKYGGDRDDVAARINALKSNIEKEYQKKQNAIDNLRPAEKVVHIHHKPDNEAVRYSWTITYQGITFSVIELPNYEKLFERKGDPEAIRIIANYFYMHTKDSKNKGLGFKYSNRNERWEQLEYGYYRNDSEPAYGEKYGSKYAHGVTDGYSYQAPKGYLRIAEAEWNHLNKSGTMVSLFTDYINGQNIKYDLREMDEEYIEILRRYNASINTKQMDFENFVIVKNPNKEDLL